MSGQIVLDPARTRDGSIDTNVCSLVGPHSISWNPRSLAPKRANRQAGAFEAFFPAENPGKDFGPCASSQNSAQDESLVGCPTVSLKGPEGK